MKPLDFYMSATNSNENLLQLKIPDSLNRPSRQSAALPGCRTRVARRAVGQVVYSDLLPADSEPPLYRSFGSSPSSVKSPGQEAELSSQQGACTHSRNSKGETVELPVASQR